MKNNFILINCYTYFTTCRMQFHFQVLGTLEKQFPYHLMKIEKNLIRIFKSI